MSRDPERDFFEDWDVLPWRVRLLLLAAVAALAGAILLVR